jgi:hypothetical protein
MEDQDLHCNGNSHLVPHQNIVDAQHWLVNYFYFRNCKHARRLGEETYNISKKENTKEHQLVGTLLVS